MKVKIKKLIPNAVVPSYAKPGDAGMDLVATSISRDEYGNYVYGTGIAVEIPEGYVGLIFPRSSNSKKDLILSNSVGVIDSGYRGEIIFKFKKNRRAKIVEDEDRHVKIVDDTQYTYEVGDRIGQIIIMPYPQVEFEEVDELTDSVRSEGGFGSSGK